VAKIVNHSWMPFVSVLLSAYKGDIHLLSRAINSLKEQSLDPRQFEVIIAYDGAPDSEAEKLISVDCTGCKFSIRAIWAEDGQQTGYYCIPLNRTITTAYGFYVIHMDVDNEFKPTHLEDLLLAIRQPHPEEGLPHFVYTKRDYVADDSLEGEPPTLGPSPYVPWTPDNIRKLMVSPKYNFIDKGDFMISRSALYELAERTGCIWNSSCLRYGDWEIMVRIAGMGYRAKALDQATHVYHWHGKNLQLTRQAEDYVVMPADQYDDMKKKGLVKDA